MSKRVLRRIGILFMSFTLIFTFVPVLNTPTSYADTNPGFSSGDIPYGISAFRDGYVYTAMWGGKKISRISLQSGHAISDVVQAKREIKSVAMDNGGNLFFNYAEDNKIYKIPASALASLPVDAESATVVYYTLADATGTVESIAFDPNDNLYLAVNTFSTSLNSWQYTLQQIAPGGTTLTRTIPVGFYVNGVTFTPSGDLYVLDNSKKVYKASHSALNQSGTIEFESVTTIDGAFPYDLTVLPDGKIVYSDRNNSTISYLGLTVEPQAPAVKASATSKEVSLTWDALPGIANYNVYQSENPSSIGSQIASVTQATYSVPGLAQGKTYYFAVTAVNSIGESPASSQVISELKAPAPPTLAKPSNNRLEADDWSVREGRSLTFFATGDRQAADGTVNGDERYVPVSWTSTEPGKSGNFVWNGTRYSSTYEPTAASIYIVTSSFQKQIWNETEWTPVDGAIDKKIHMVSIIPASEGFPTHDGAREIDEYNGYIYTAHRGLGEISRTSVADSTVSTVVKGIRNVMSVALGGNGDLYYTKDSDSNIYKVPASNLATLPVDVSVSVPQVVYNDASSNYIYNLEVDEAGVIYYTSSVSGKISLHKLDSGKATKVFDNFNHGISGLAFAPTGDLYILTKGSEIYKATPSQLAAGDSSSLTLLTKLQNIDPIGLAILQDGSILYTDIYAYQGIWYSGQVVPLVKKASPDRNTISVNPFQVEVGGTIALKAEGDLQSVEGRLNGDERYIPKKWNSSETGQSGTFALGEHGYTSSYTPGTAGRYMVTVSFQKQTWNGTQWTDVEGDIDTKTDDVTASAGFPTHQDAREMDEHNGYIYTAHRGLNEITRTSVANSTVDIVVTKANNVMAVALSDNGDLYFTKDGDSRIYMILASALTSLPVNADTALVVYEDTDSSYLYSLEVDGAGVIYYTSSVNGNTSLRKLDNGEATTVFVNFNNRISGLAFAPTGDLYILTESSEIYKATPSQLASGVQSSLTLVTKLKNVDPAGLAVLPDGSILYTDYDNDQGIWYSGQVIPLVKKASPDRNTIGVNPTQVEVGGTIALKAEGDLQSVEGRLNGDERYIPLKWSSTEAGQSGTFALGEHGYTSSYTPGTAGSYTITVTFQKQTWNGTKWTDVSEETDTKTVNISVNSVSSVKWNELNNGLDVVGGLNGPGYTTVDRDGNVYVTDTGNNRILKWAVSGEHAGTWQEWPVDASSGLGALNRPEGIATDGNGNLYVVDSGNKRILKRTSTGTWSELSSDLGGELGQLVRPFAITVDKNNNLYVTDHDRILKFDAVSQNWSKIDTSNGPTGVNGLAVDEYGNLYAADTAGSRIMKLTVSGEGTGTWTELGNGPGSGLGQFRYPNGVAVDSNGNVYVADSVNDRIQIWMAATGAWSEWTTAGEGLGKLNKPTSIVTDLNGNVYVVDNVNNRVLLVTVLVQYPGAPTDVTATAGDGEATIRFTAPANNGGSPITGYTVTAYPGGIKASGKESPIVITGLTNGTSYTFTVKATNAAGSSVSSASSNAIVPKSSSNESGNPPSGSDNPSVPGTPNSSVEVLINGVAEKAGTATTTQRAGQTVTSITLDWNKLTAKLSAGGAGTVITITTHNGSDVVVGELNGQMVKDLENKQALLVIQTNQATYTLPAQQINIDAISKQLGKSVTLADIKVQVEIAISASGTLKLVEDTAKKGSFTLVAPPMDFTIRAIYGDTTIELKKFNAPVERMIAIPAGADTSHITTGVVVEPDGSVRHVPTQIVVIDGKTYARINSLTNSTYAVVWHPLEFNDMANHWAKTAVNDMGSRMIINGVGNELFKPDMDITRAELAAILVRGLGLAPERGATEFSDVPSTEWYNDTVHTAYIYGLIKGFQDGTFRPSAKVTREEAMVMIARAMEITRLQADQNSGTPENQLSKFKDKELVSEWAKTGIEVCLQAGIVSGKGNGLLEPKAHTTRAEVAVMIEQLLQKSKLI